jgi:ligand-binding sensor domain-containing protein/signal transduction histidine kinase
MSLIILSASVLVPKSSFAIDPHRAVSQYLHHRWTGEEGSPQGNVYAINQTADGYLWIGSDAGLSRYDGVFHLILNDALRLDYGPVFGLTPDGDGNLWVNHLGPKLFRYRSGVIVPRLEDGLPYSQVTATARGIDGRLVAAAPGQGIVTFREGGFQVLLAENELPRSTVTAVAQTGDGTVWIGTRDAGLFQMSAGRVSHMAGLTQAKVNCLFIGKDLNLWIGTDDGVFFWNGKQIRTVQLGNTKVPVQVLALLQDRDQNLWVGTGGQGLLRVNSGGFTSLHIGSSPSLNDSVTALFEDREGSLWIGSGGGIDRLRDTAFLTYSGPEGLPFEGNAPISVDTENRLWFAPIEGGLWWLQGESSGRVSEGVTGSGVIYSIAPGKHQIWLGKRGGGLTCLSAHGNVLTSRTYTERDGLAENNVFSVYESRDGSVWAGTLSSGVSKLSGERFTTYTTLDGLASNHVLSIVEDMDGVMWFGTLDGLSSFNGRHWRTYTAADGLPSGRVTCLLQDSKGVLWVGTAAGIAYRTEAGFRKVAEAQEGLLERTLGIAEDRVGWLWISSATHILRAKRNQLLAGKLPETDVREYGIADGLRGTDGVERFRSVVGASDGRIWFSTTRGISVVDPSRLGERSAPALVHIQAVSADGDSIDASGTVRIPPGRQRITISYTATILSVPDRVRFRYRLDRVDHTWSEPMPTKQAFYMNLGPGSYRFRVRASNADGLWDSPEAILAFEVEPQIWQATWFRASVVATFGFSLVAFYRLRMNQVKQQLNVRFEERLAERTRIAQELHDTLLQGFVSAFMQLHVLADRTPDDWPTKPSLGRIIQLVSQVIEEGRKAVRGLRSTSSHETDLGHSFSQIPNELGIGSESRFRLVLDGHPQVLHPLIRDEIYRIGREALTNAFRHSHAKNVEMEITYGSKFLRVLVRDDGCGIDPLILAAGRAGHWGLRGMRERSQRIGGTLHVRSRAMAGTEVELSLNSRIAYEGSNAISSIGRLLRFRTGFGSRPAR